MLVLLLGCSMANKWGTDLPVSPSPTDTAEDADTDDTAEDSGAAGARAPRRGDLVIAEVLVDPGAVADELGEWVELLSLTTDHLDLSGVTFSDADGNTFVVTDGTSLPAGGRLVLGASADRTVNGDAPVDVAWGEALKLGNDADAAVLALGAEALDEVAWDDAAGFSVPESSALVLTAADAGPDDNDVSGAWCPATSVFGGGDRGTPGAPNDACGAVDDLDGDGLTAADGDCDDHDADTWPGALEAADGEDDDCDGTVDERAPDVGDLVIAEVMKNPDPTEDEIGEWFEVVNVSGDTLDLADVVVTDEDGESFSLSGLLAPYALLVAGASLDTTVNGGLTPDLVWPEGSFRLGNDDDEIILGIDGVEIDALAYDDDFPDDKGEALSLDALRFSSDDNDDPDAWCGADGTYGADGNEGTPGEANPTCR